MSIKLMQSDAKIIVTSKSFSNSETLKQRTLSFFPNATFLPDGVQTTPLRHLFESIDGAIIGLDKVDQEVLESSKQLKILSKFGVGLDNLPLDLCLQHGVKVGWTAGVNKLSAAEQTLGLMIGLSRNLMANCIELKGGHWNKKGGRELSELTVGIIGVGHIGKTMIKLLKPFGCNLLVNDIYEQSEFYVEQGVREVSKEELLEQSDIVTCHVPLTKETAHLINKNSLGLMRSDAFLINTSRGGVVDLNALKWGLQTGVIAGAAIDVYETEPPTDTELLSLQNLICTPHTSGNSRKAVESMGNSAIDHLVSYFIDGKRDGFIV